MSEQQNSQSVPEVPGSPDFLRAQKRGHGVRRLNRRPLLLVGAVMSLAILGVTYTFYQRSVSHSAPASNDASIGPLQTKALPPVKPDGDMLTPPVAPDTEVLPTVTAEPEQKTAPIQTSATEPPEDPDLQRHRLFLQQVEDRRLARYAEALDADGKVQLTDRGNSHNSLGQGSEPRQPASSGSADEAAISGDEAGSESSYGHSHSSDTGNGSSMVAENRQVEKRAFLSNSAEADNYLQRQRTSAIAPSLEIKAGTVIPGVMISGINSDLPGTIIGQVRQDVYDSATGGNLLVPAGAKLIGTYDSGITLGQSRALVVWQRIIYPDSSSLSLANMPGTDVGGYAGFHDKVNNHYMRIFGNALLLSAFSAGVQLSQPQASKGENVSASQTITGALGQQLGELGIQMAQRNMNIQPTLEIRPGYRFNVMVTKDIILPPWQGHPLSPAR